LYFLHLGVKQSLVLYGKKGLNQMPETSAEFGIVSRIGMYCVCTSIAVDKHNFRRIKVLFTRLGYMLRLNIKPSSGP
jgi:hypothetical protein